MIIRAAILGCTLALTSSAPVLHIAVDFAAIETQLDAAMKRPAPENNREPRPRPHPVRDFG